MPGTGEWSSGRKVGQWSWPVGGGAMKETELRGRNSAKGKQEGHGYVDVRLRRY